MALPETGGAKNAKSASKSILKNHIVGSIFNLHRIDYRLVGSMQPAKIDFLKNQGVKVFGNNGGHGFNEKEYEHILNFIRGN